MTTRRQRSSQLRRPFTLSQLLLRAVSWSFCLLLLLPSTVTAISNAYCDASLTWNSNISVGASCAPCSKIFDRCKPLDMYWENDNVCLLPDSIERAGLHLCGSVVEKLPLVSSSGNVSGKLTIFQTVDMFMYITFQMACPYVLRSGNDASYAPFSASLYAWQDVTQQTSPQYVDLFPGHGSYTCITYVVNLRRVCEPARSTYTYAPIAARNAGCTCLPGSSPCPPLDLSNQSEIVFIPQIRVAPADENCRDDVFTAGEYTGGYETFHVVTLDGSGAIRWAPEKCSAWKPPPPPSPTPSIMIIMKPTEKGSLAPPPWPPPSSTPQLPPTPLSPPGPLGVLGDLPPPVPTESPPPVTVPGPPAAPSLPPRPFPAPPPHAPPASPVSGVPTGGGGDAMGANPLGQGPAMGDADKLAGEAAPPSSLSRADLEGIVGGAVGGVLLILAAAGILMYRRRGQRAAAADAAAAGDARQVGGKSLIPTHLTLLAAECRGIAPAPGGRGSASRDNTPRPSLRTTSQLSSGSGSTVTIVTDGEFDKPRIPSAPGVWSMRCFSKPQMQPEQPPADPPLSWLAFAAPSLGSNSIRSDDATQHPESSPPSFSLSVVSNQRPSAPAAGAPRTSQVSALVGVPPGRHGPPLLPQQQQQQLLPPHAPLRSRPSFTQIDHDVALEWQALEQRAGQHPGPARAHPEITPVPPAAAPRPTHPAAAGNAVPSLAGDASAYVAVPVQASGPFPRSPVSPGVVLPHWSQASPLRTVDAAQAFSLAQARAETEMDEVEDCGMCGPFAALAAAIAVQEGSSASPASPHVLPSSSSSPPLPTSSLISPASSVTHHQSTSFSAGGGGLLASAGMAAGEGTGWSSSTSGRHPWAAAATAAVAGGLASPSSSMISASQHHSYELSPKSSSRSMANLQHLVEAAGPSGDVTAAAAAAAAAVACGEEVDADELALVLLQRRAAAEAAAEAAADMACDDFGRRGSSCGDGS